MITRAAAGEAGAMVVAAICLCTATAGAAQPKAVALPATGSGMTTALLDVVDDTIADKLDALGFEAVQASQAAAPAGADLVVETVVSKQGESAQVTIVATYPPSGSSKKVSASTSTGGMLARISKMIAEVAALPPAVVTVAPSSEAPAVLPEKATAIEIEEQDIPDVKYQDMTSNPQVFQGNGKTLLLADEEVKGALRASTGLLVSGTILTLAGIGLTIFAVHEWKDFDRWQAWAQENQCTECVSQVAGKVKKNAALTGVSAGLLIPGSIILIAGITKRLTAVKMRDRAAAAIPSVALSASPGGSGGLQLSWTF